MALAMDEILSNMAHQIAAEWHGGQTSQVYSFVSTGKVFDKDALLAEIKDAIETSTGVDDDVSNMRELCMLYLYVQQAEEAHLNIDPAGRTFPSWEQLVKLPVLHTGQMGHDLRIEVAYPLETNFSSLRVWTARNGMADGEPYDHTVYVEVREVVERGRSDSWYDLGHYDGDNPPEALPGLTATALRNMIDLPPVD